MDDRPHVLPGLGWVSLPLKEGQKSEGATLDRFGLFTSDIGGQQVKIYLDDLKYTARK